MDLSSQKKKAEDFKVNPWNQFFFLKFSHQKKEKQDCTQSLDHHDNYYQM